MNSEEYEEEYGNPLNNLPTNEGSPLTQAGKIELIEDKDSPICDECGGVAEWLDRNAEEDLGKTLCYECLYNKYEECDRCGKWCSNNEFEASDKAIGGHICEKCLVEFFKLCDQCNNWVEIEEEWDDKSNTCFECSSGFCYICHDWAKKEEYDNYHNMCFDCLSNKGLPLPKDRNYPEL